MENNKKGLQVYDLKIRNVLGIKELHVVPGKSGITVIAGKNGTGKSSLLAVANLLAKGGNIQTLRNVDAEEDDPTEVIALLTDGVDNYRYIDTDKKTEVKRQVGDSVAYEKIGMPPRQWLNQFFDKATINPLDFCDPNIDDKNRVKMLLEAIDLDYHANELWDSIGLNPLDYPPVCENHPLKEIEAIRKNIYDRRTGINRDENANRSTAEKIAETIPAQMPIVENLEEKEKELSFLQQDIIASKMNANAARDRVFEIATADKKAFIEKLDLEINNKIQALDIENTNQISELQSSYDQSINDLKEKIRALENECLQRRDEINQQYTDRLSEIEKSKNLKIEKLNDATNTAINAAHEEHTIRMSKIWEKEQAAHTLELEIQQSKNTQKEIVQIMERRKIWEKYEADANSLLGQSERLTEALDALDRYKAKLCENLPIEGLDVADNKVKVNGVPWEQLNTATHYKIGVQVACLRQKSKGLTPFVIVDRIEQLDSEHFSLLENELKEQGAIAFMAKVDDIPLSIFTGENILKQINEKKENLKNGN